MKQSTYLEWDVGGGGLFRDGLLFYIASGQKVFSRGTTPSVKEPVLCVLLPYEY